MCPYPPTVLASGGDPCAWARNSLPSAAFLASHPHLWAPSPAAAPGWAAPDGSLGRALFLHIGPPPITQRCVPPLWMPLFVSSHSHSRTLLFIQHLCFLYCSVALCLLFHFSYSSSPFSPNPVFLLGLLPPYFVVCIFFLPYLFPYIFHLLSYGGGIFCYFLLVLVCSLHDSFIPFLFIYLFSQVGLLKHLRSNIHVISSLS